MSSCVVESAPHRLDFEHSVLFTPAALDFLQAFVTRFDARVDHLMLKRNRRRVDMLDGNWIPSFRTVDATVNPNWTIDEIPQRLRNRKLDLGDVSPANTINFIDSMYADVQGLQVDFDDGHCPTWRNTVQGIYNVTAAVHSRLPGAPADMEAVPILMMRPRAFNMIEHNCMINNKEVPAPLFDFGLLMYHNGFQMHRLGIGPYFYLSKIEDHEETELWNEMFEWTQQRLAIPYGTIKVCVLIENILAAYCMENILYSIRHHAIGLNCGIWDYAASIIAKLGDSQSFVIPDRRKYVNMRQPFLAKYMRLLIATCHRHGALATGGMAAQTLPPGKGTCTKSLDILATVKQNKRFEIEAGVDGFMVYDIRMVQPIAEFWSSLCPGDNQMHILPDCGDIMPHMLIELPKGGVTTIGLRQNIAIALLLIYHWLSGSGVFFYNGFVEDSATAEISRSQVWQWIRFATPIEDKGNAPVTHKLVYQMLDEIVDELRHTMTTSMADCKRLVSAKYMLLEIVTAKNYIEYITTYLNDSHKFRSLHNKNEGLQAKL